MKRHWWWRRGRPPRTEGSAVALVLLLTLALTAVGHAALLVALQEEAQSRASVAVLQARLLAEGGLRRALRDELRDSLPRFDGGVAVMEGGGPSGSVRVQLRRLAAEIYRLDGEGRASLVPGGPQRVHDRAARLLWSLSPVARLRALDAVVEHGAGVEGGAVSIEADAVGDRGLLAAPAGCRDLGPSLDSALSGRVVTTSAATLGASARPLPELGLLEHDSLLARIDRRVAGTVTPASVLEDGRCKVEALTNWGSPSDPGGPCGGHRPSLASDGDLTLVGGEGQGLLVVAGSLTLSAARFDGLVLVGGDLTVDRASLLVGAVRVRGRVRIEGGGRISGRFCTALLALEASSRLRRPLSLPGAGWLRPI